MRPQSQPDIGSWYSGEHHAGAFRVIRCDESCGVIYLRGTDGRLVRMTFERWSRQPLNPVPGSVRLSRGPDCFEWNEPVIG
jgi:hypothetical protein